MVGYNEKNSDSTTFCCQVIKLFVNSIVAVGYFNQGLPFVAGESDEVNSCIAADMLHADRHTIKINARMYKTPGVSPQGYAQGLSAKTPGGQ